MYLQWSFQVLACHLPGAAALPCLQNIVVGWLTMVTKPAACQEYVRVPDFELHAAGQMSSSLDAST